jgi:hypothetical protein
MAIKIDTILKSYHFKTLSEMASAAGLDLYRNGKKLSKRELLPQMRREFFTQERVLASLKQLDKREEAVLNRLLLHGEAVTVKRFRRELVRAELATAAVKTKSHRHLYSSVPYADGYIGHPDRPSSIVFEDIIARLTYYGLVFSRAPSYSMGSAPYKIQFHPAAVLFIPQVIRRYLPEPVPIEYPNLEPPRVQTGDPMLLLRDLYLYWDFERWMKAIDKVLLVPDSSLKEARSEKQTGRLYLLRCLLEALKLIQRQGNRLSPTGKSPVHIPDFWSKTLAEQLSACLEAWPRLTGQIGMEGDAGRYNPRYEGACQVLLKEIKKLPASIWFSPDELLERVQGADVNFLFSDHTQVENYRGQWYYNYSSGYYSERTRDLLKAFEENEERFVKGCLIGFLHRIGAVELGYDGDQWVAFRSIADFSSTTASGGGKLIVQPSFQLMAMGPVNLALLARLDLFADRERADERVFEYRLSRESIYRAQQLGMETAECIRFLVDASDTALPQNVRRSLEEWAAHHERIVFRTDVSLLQAADADTLTRLMDKARTGQYLPRSLSPGVALITKGGMRSLVIALVEQGFLPAVSSAEPEAADKSVIVDQDGTIRPIHAVPSLHLRGRLARMAEEVRSGEWKLTPASVRQAGGSKNKVLWVLDELCKLHRGILSQELVDQIKAWGNYYGDAAVESVILVEFRDRATLDELRKNPDLQTLLTPFPAGNRALAVVSQDKLQEIQEILARFGVSVQDGLAR